MSLKRYQNFVDGRYLANASGEYFEVINPASGAVIYEVEVADEAVQTAAIASAQKGFALWSAMSGVERGRILLRAVALLRERNDILAAIEVADTGKPWQEASVVDVVTGADSIEFFAGLAAAIEGNQQQLGADFYYSRREPLGVCAGIGAWNYPLQIACWKAAPALACGNSMIFKPSEETPLGALKLAEIFIEAGMPAGVFNVVQGDGRVGAWLSQAPEVAKISFTGEVGTGKKVMRAAAETLKGVTMELGGKSPLIIFDDADLEEAVSAAMVANFYTQGEVCTNGTRVYVQQGIYPAFMARLLARTRDNIRIGDPMDPATNFGALISREHQRKVLSYYELARQEGGVAVAGGGIPEMPQELRAGSWIEPTVWTGLSHDSRVAREEIFGPCCAVIPFDTEAEVVAMANDTRYGLAASVYTSNIDKAHRVASQLRVGVVWVNSWFVRDLRTPFGGSGASGIGREGGVHSVEFYTELSNVCVKFKGSSD